MKYFNFVVEKKISMWKRENIVVEAKNEKEAQKIMKSILDGSEESMNGIHTSSEEYIYETEEVLDPKYNMGHATLEAFDKYPYDEESCFYSNNVKQEEKGMK